MPFAALPSSPGFQQPAAPDWGRFAELAIQQIQHGGDIRAQAGKDFAEHLDKSFMQVSKIMEYNSPEAKAKRQMEMMQTQAMTEVYKDFKAHPENYLMTAHGPVAKDPFTQAMKVTQYRNAQVTGEINTMNRDKAKKASQLSQGLDDFRKTYNSYDSSKLGPPPDNSSVPPGTTGSTSATTPEPDAGSGQIPVVPDTTVPTGSTGSDTDVNGNPLVDVNGNPIITQ
jgi:hypothetical protein